MNPKKDLTKAVKLLRGIDNDSKTLQKKQKDVQDRIQNVINKQNDLSKILSGLGNSSITKSAPAKSAPAKVVAPVKKPVSKPAKPQKPAKATKPASKATKPAKTVQKVTKVNAGVQKPSLKSVINDILKNSPGLTPSDIYDQSKKVGTWSRQSLYMALKDKSFTKDEKGMYFVGTSNNSVPTDSLVPSSDAVEATPQKDEEMENFISNAEKSEVSNGVVSTVSLYGSPFNNGE